MGMENPVGKWIGFENDAYRTNIIGVVKDFNFRPRPGNRTTGHISQYGQDEFIDCTAEWRKISCAIEHTETT